MIPCCTAVFQNHEEMLHTAEARKNFRTKRHKLAKPVSIWNVEEHPLIGVLLYIQKRVQTTNIKLCSNAMFIACWTMPKNNAKRVCHTFSFLIFIATFKYNLLM